MAEVHTPEPTNAVSAGESEEGHAAPGHAEMVGETADHGGGHVEPTAWGFDASGWVALAMVAIFILLIWKRVPAAVGKALDKKIGTIRQQLDEAAQLRAEAEALRGEYEARAAQAEAEVQTMLERARHEAEGIVAQAESNAAALVERRTRMAEDKIGAEERAAVKQLRAAAADSAARAAARLIAERDDPATDEQLVNQTIGELGSR